MTNEERKKFKAKNLLILIALCGVSKRQVAEAIGITQDRLSKLIWGQGLMFPRASELESLCDFFGVSKEHFTHPLKVSIELVKPEEQKPQFLNKDGAISIEI